MNTKARNYANKKHCESCREYRFCKAECKKWVDTYFDYQNGLETGRKEREDDIKQVEKSREEIQKNWHDCFLSCSSPYCAAHFPAVEMQGELGNMSKREPEAEK